MNALASFVTMSRVCVTMSMSMSLNLILTLILGLSKSKNKSKSYMPPLCFALLFALCGYEGVKEGGDCRGGGHQWLQGAGPL